MKLQVISLFTGAGGFDLGFELEGANTIVATDVHATMVETLRYNQGRCFGGTRFLHKADIHQADLSKSLELISSYEGDIVLGGPPCQSFSAIGSQHGYRGHRGNLIYSFGEIIQRIKPKFFLFENVPNMKSQKWGSLFAKFTQYLECEGLFEVGSFMLNCADYGCATYRERIFILGCRHDLGIRPSPPPPTHSSPGDLFGAAPHVTVREAFKGLPPATKKFDFPFLHFAPDHEPQIVDRFKKLKSGERDQIRRRNRLHHDKPAFTIFAGGEKGGTRAHIHPVEPRELTPRELARLHGFPDEFTFRGNKSQIAIQIVNSVPVPIASAWARHIASLAEESRVA